MFIFAVVFGLSTDYAVFLLTRIKEARDQGLDDRAAVSVGLQRTGRIVTAAALLFAIALGATLVRALLVPSLMAMLGKANWWAPGPLRRFHDRLGISDELPEPPRRPAPASHPACHPPEASSVRPGSLD